MKTHDGKSDFLEVSQENGLVKVSSGYEAPIRLLFSYDAKLYIKTLFKKTTEQNFFNFEHELLNFDVINNALSTLSDKYVFCPGIPKVIYNMPVLVIHFKNQYLFNLCIFISFIGRMWWTGKCQKSPKYLIPF